MYKVKCGLGTAPEVKMLPPETNKPLLTEHGELRTYHSRQLNLQ